MYISKFTPLSLIHNNNKNYPISMETIEFENKIK